MSVEREKRPIWRTILIIGILGFMLWFVSVMSLNSEHFNYYENAEKLDYTQINPNLFESKAEMMTHMRDVYPIHYVLLSYQTLIFACICVFFFPYAKVKRLYKKLIVE